MAKNSWNDYSTTAASNTDVHSVSIAEGMAPSDVNNAMRELMVDVANFDQGNVTLTSALAVASGGTGAATHTANNVLVGAGTSAVSSVAPGSSGNVLTSNGSTWSSTAAPATDLTAIADGSVGSPSLANSGDTNTGIYFPAADTVGVTAGGTEQFRFGSIEGGANPIGTKNLLLNGGFTVNQRGSVTGLGGTSYVYHLDGWCHYGTSSSGRYTASQATAGSTDGPFRHCLQVDVTTADTDTSGNNISAVLQKMEGQNLQHLNWGQATDDYPLAVSFWVKSPKSGTHCVAVYLQEGNDSCTTEYTVDSADTWQYVTVDFPAPGTSVPVIDNDANASLWLVFPLMATGTYQSTADAWQTSTEGYATSNQQNLLDNVSNDFFLANVQLELGSVSTSYQAEDIGTTRQKCQRYYEQQGGGAGQNFGAGMCTATTSGHTILRYTEKRVAPTISVSAASDFVALKGSGYDENVTSTAFGAIGTNLCNFNVGTGGNLTAGQGVLVRDDGGASARIYITAEL